MDPESKKLLEDTFNLAQENNKMLRKVRSVQKWATFWSGLKIFIIIGVALGAFYFIEPYLDPIINYYGSAAGLNADSDSPSSFRSLLEKF